MSISNYSLTGSFPYKMDAKCRVSIPGEWRSQIADGELQLLQSSNEKLPTLRVLTKDEFENMQREVHESALTPAKKRAILGALFERCHKTHINEQGKLSVPKALLEHPGLVAGETLQLCGRGDYIEILNEKNYLKLRAATQPELDELDEEFGFF